MVSISCSDTVAREQQIRELNHHVKQVSCIPKVQTRQRDPRYCEIIIIAAVHIMFACFTIGRILINNEPLIRQVYYVLIDASTEGFTGDTSSFETIP